MRVVMLLLLTALAGCVDDGPDGLEAEDASAGVADAPAPEPVDIHHTYDLSAGLFPTEWSMKVHENYTSGGVRIWVEPLAYLNPSNACVQFDVTQYRGTTREQTSGSRGSCATASVSVSVSVTQLGDKQIISYTGDDFAAGSYRFTGSADPQPGVLHVVMHAAYD